jgi:MoxR-like ATPase
MDLCALTDTELIALGCRINDGSFGVDPGRKTPSKEAKAAYLRRVAAARYGENGKTVLENGARSILAARRGQDGQRDVRGVRGVETTESRVTVDDTDGSGSGEPGLPDGTPMEMPQPGPTEPLVLTVNGDEGSDADGEPDAPQGPQTGGKGQGDGDAFGDPDDAADDAPRPPVDSLEARVREMIGEAMEAATDDAAEGIAEAIEARLGDAVAAIRKEIAEREPRRVETTVKLGIPDLPEPVRVDDRHPIYGKGLALLSLPAEYRQGWGLALVGPAGSGKTTIFQQWADDLKARFGAVSCSADMTRGVIDGRILPIGDGRYVPSELVRMVDEGGRALYLFDEFDAAAPEIIVAVNAPLANGGMHVEPRSFAGLPTYLTKDPEFRFGAALNTFGTGPTAQYTARSAQDAASMDRWLILYMDHDYAMWYGWMGADDLYERPAPWVPVVRTEDELRKAFRDAVVTIHAWAVRANERQLKRVVSGRAVLKARACLAAGFSWDDTRDVILAGWKDDERAQVLE